MKQISKYSVLFLFFIILQGLFVGCASQPEKAMEFERPLLIDTPFETAWLATKNELKARGFTIAHLNKRDGVIETYPLSSRQWFEFWRRDVVGENAIAEASMQNIRRKVVAQFFIDSEDETLSLDCYAEVQRMVSKPEAARLITRGEDMFASTSNRMPTLQSRFTKKKIPDEWMTLRRDYDLEVDIMEHLQRQLSGN